jgi:hypothetical protein
MYSKNSPFKFLVNLFLPFFELPYLKVSPFLHSHYARQSIGQEKTRIQTYLFRKEHRNVHQVQKKSTEYLIHNSYSSLSPFMKRVFNPHPCAIQTYHHSIQSSCQCDPKISPVTLKHLTQIAATSLLSTCLMA